MVSALALLSAVTFLSVRSAQPPSKTDEIAVITGAVVSAAEPTPTPAALATSTTSALTTEEVVTIALPWVVRVLADSGSGSGVIVSDGLVATNAHVVVGSGNVEIVSRDGSRFRATVEAVNEDADLALVRFAATVASSAHLGDPRSLALGEPLIAIGYALGSVLEGEPTITRGVFSGLRTLDDGFEYVQTDAAINPGNSGGPLITLKGDVVGLSNFVVRGTRFEGLSFAVSSQTLKGFVAAGDEWQRASASLDEAWGDWERAIDLLDDFLGQNRGYGPAKEKLYSALVSSAQESLAKGDRIEAVRVLTKAREILPSRVEARAALLALTPTPTARPTATPIPTSSPRPTATATARPATPRPPTPPPVSRLPEAIQGAAAGMMTLSPEGPFRSGTLDVCPDCSSRFLAASFVHPGGGRGVPVTLFVSNAYGEMGRGVGLDAYRVRDGAYVGRAAPTSATSSRIVLQSPLQGDPFLLLVYSTLPGTQISFTLVVDF